MGGECDQTTILVVKLDLTSAIFHPFAYLTALVLHPLCSRPCSGTWETTVQWGRTVLELAASLRTGFLKGAGVPASISVGDFDGIPAAHLRQLGSFLQSNDHDSVLGVFMMMF